MYKSNVKDEGHCDFFRPTYNKTRSRAAVLHDEGAPFRLDRGLKPFALHSALFRRAEAAHHSAVVRIGCLYFAENNQTITLSD